MVEVAPGVMKRFTDMTEGDVVGARALREERPLLVDRLAAAWEKIRRRLKSGERIPSPDWTQWFDEGPRSQATNILTLRARVHELEALAAPPGS